MRFVQRREAYYDRVLRRSLLMDVRPRTVTLMGAGGIVALALICYVLTGHPLPALVGGAAGAL